MRKSKGFTLVELLVVIGIIALLISMLLPVLGGIRRQAGQTKCLSSLRQIGVALQLYAQEQEGYYPVAYWDRGTAAPTDVPREASWPDMLSKYVHAAAAADRDDVSSYRRGSVLWGCPAYDVSENFDPSSFGDAVRTGYGMQYYPMAPATATVGNGTGPKGNLAYIDNDQPSVGTWFKRDVWTRKGSSLRGIIADSNTHIIGTSATYSQSTGWFQKGRELLPPSGTTSFVYMDGSRHVKPNATDREVRRATGINMLFADGSVRAVSPAEAWKATRGGGVTNFSN
jgi:prepilin-type N-terminal cleavage/methylation domain-containing protein/prepilin-type processing-associated H-X9-DG protein